MCEGSSAGLCTESIARYRTFATMCHTDKDRHIETVCKANNCVGQRAEGKQRRTSKADEQITHHAPYMQLPLSACLRMNSQARSRSSIEGGV